MYYMNKKPDPLKPPAKPKDTKKSASFATILTEFIGTSRTVLRSISNVKSQSKGSSIASIGSSSLRVVEETQSSNKSILPTYLKRMPHCAEKVLIKLDYLCSLLETPEQADDEKVESLHLDFESEMKNLDDRLQLEELYTDKVKEFCEKIEQTLEAKDFKSASEHINELLLTLREINIQKLLLLSQSSNESLRILKDKNVHMLIGMDENEKSMVLNLLSDNNQKKPNMILEGIVLDLSEIQFLNPVVIPLKDDGNAIFCNSPTPILEDTSKIEIYISNSIAFLKALHACSGVKPILLTSKPELERFEDEFFILTRAFSGVFLRFEEDLEHFAYAYTQYKTGERSILKKHLLDAEKCLDESNNNDNFIRLIIEDMILKHEHAAILKPTDQPVKILKKIMGDSFITNTKDHFKMSLNQRARQKIEAQILKHFSSIEKSILRNDSDLAVYKFNELIEFKTLLDQDDINERFDELFENLMRNLNKEKITCIKKFNQILEKSDQSLTNSDQNLYVSCLKKAKDMDYFVNQLGKRTRTSESSMFEELNENLNNQIEAIIENIKSRDLFAQLERVKIDLENLKNLCEINSSFKEDDYEDDEEVFENALHNCYKEACDYLSKIINQHSAVYHTRLIESNDFDEITAEMIKFKKVSQYLFTHLDENVDVYYENLKKCVLTKFKNYLDECGKIFRKDEITDDEIKKTIQIDSHFYQATHNYSLHDHIPANQIEDFYSEFQKKFLQFLKRTTIDPMKQTLNVNEFNLRRAKNEIDSFQRGLYQMKMLRETENIERFTHEIHNESAKILNELFKLIKNEINNNIDLFITQKDDRILSNLRLLKRLSWIEDYKKNLYKNLLVDVEEDLTEILSNLQRSLKSEVSFSIENHENVEKIWRILDMIFSMDQLEEFCPDVEKIVSKYKKWLVDEMHREFQKINDTTSEYLETTSYKSDLNYDFIQQAIYFLEACKTIPDVYKTDWKRPQEKVKSLLKKRFEFNKSVLDESFDFVSQANVQNQLEAIENARNMSAIFSEIEDIKKNNLKSFEIQSDEFLSKWANKLNEKYDDLENEIETHKLAENFERVNDKLACVKAFSKLESFLKHSKFSDLHTKYNTLSRQDFKSLYDLCMEMIEFHKFENLADSIAKLNKYVDNDESNEHYIKKLKFKLNSKLKSIYKEALFNARFVENLDENMLQNISKNFECIKSAKEFISNFIENIEEIYLFEIELKDTMNKSVLKYLDSIEDSIKKIEINLSEQKIKHILHVRHLIELFCEEITLHRINNLNNDRKKAVLSIIENFKSYDVAEYVHHSPKEIFVKLNGQNDFEDALKILRKNICEKFSDKLDEAKRVSPPSLENEHIKKCEKAWYYLPDEMKNEIQNLILEAIKDIEKNILNTELNLLSQLNTSDYETVVGLLKNFEKQNQIEYMNIIKNFVMTQNNAIIQELNRNFVSKNVNEVLENFEKLESLNKTFCEHFPQLKNDFIAILARIRLLFNDSYQSLIEIFESNKNARINRKFNKNEESLHLNYEIIYRIVQKDNQAENRNIFNNSPQTLFNDKYNQIYLEFQK
jgi:hypothetical protein